MSFNDGIKKLEEHLEELLGNGTFTQGEFEQVKAAIVGRIPTDRSEESLTSSEESPDRSDESLPCRQYRLMWPALMLLAVCILALPFVVHYFQEPSRSNPPNPPTGIWQFDGNPATILDFQRDGRIAGKTLIGAFGKRVSGTWKGDGSVQLESSLLWGDKAPTWFGVFGDEMMLIEEGRSEGGCSEAFIRRFSRRKADPGTTQPNANF